MAKCTLRDHIEVWKPVPFNPHVEASQFGHLRRARDRKILGQHIDTNGYFNAVVGPNRKRIRTSIAICAAFHGPKPGNDYVVCHNNGDRLDNRAVNLRWATQKENIQDKYRHGTIGYGERNPFAKLSETDVREIRGLCDGGRYGGGANQREVAARYGVTQAAVSAIVTRKVWGHIE